LLELLDALNLREPIDLVGYSLGGGIVTDFAARHPQRVRRLALISPVVYNFQTPLIFRIPVIGEFLARIIGIRTVTKRANSMYEGTRFGQLHADLFAEQTTFKGFQTSLLSMIRNNAIGDHRDSYEAVGKQKRSVLLIWGSRDTEIPEEAINTARKLIPHVQFHALQDAGHNIVFQKPEQTSAVLISFLRSNT
jgi:pimeloyl-ACP methyl ester carboxylesterase